MDRKTHSFSWPTSCPVVTSAPGWFAVNGMGYHPLFTGGGGIENMGLGVPVWFQSPDLRAMPAMPNPRQQPVFTAHEASGTPSNNNTNAAPATVSRPRSPPPPAANHANSNISTGALVPSRPSSPMAVDSAMQCLSGQLHDAIWLCTDCLKMHAEFVAKVHFTTAETRNAVWRDLLEHKFKSSGFLQDGFHNLGRRLDYYMEQAHCASQHDPALTTGEHERQREAKDMARRLRLLRATCDEVVRLSDGASRDMLDCQEMLALMKDMKKKLDRKADNKNRGENKEDDDQEGGKDGGNTDNAHSTDTWSAGA